MIGMYFDEKTNRCVVGCPSQFRERARELVDLYFSIQNVRRWGKVKEVMYKSHFRVFFRCTLNQFNAACKEMQYDMLTVENSHSFGRLMR